MSKIVTRPAEPVAAVAAKPAVDVEKEALIAEIAALRDAQNQRIEAMEAAAKQRAVDEDAILEAKAKWWIPTQCKIINSGGLKKCKDCGKIFTEFIPCDSEKNKYDTFKMICGRKAAAAAKLPNAADVAAALLPQAGDRRDRTEE